MRSLKVELEKLTRLFELKQPSILILLEDFLDEASHKKLRTVLLNPMAFVFKYSVGAYFSLRFGAALEVSNRFLLTFINAIALLLLSVSAILFWVAALVWIPTSFLVIFRTILDAFSNSGGERPIIAITALPMYSVKWLFWSYGLALLHSLLYVFCAPIDSERLSFDLANVLIRVSKLRSKIDSAMDQPLADRGMT